METDVEGAIEGARAYVKTKLVTLLKAIYYNEKKRVPDYSEITGMSSKTVERYIRILRNSDLIDFVGEGTKVGGYILTAPLKEVIEKRKQ